MPFEIIRNDITRMRVDAIVNTANPRPVIGSGTDAAIHMAAGPELLECRKEIGFIDTGKVAITPGFSLPAKFVIHTVGPVWYDGGHGEAWLLRQCYDNALQLAVEQGLESIAFPLISTGNYGFPKQLALQVATEAITQFLLDHEMMVYLVVFSKRSFELSGKLMANVRSFIDENYVEEKEKAEYGFTVRRAFEAVQQFFEQKKAPPTESQPLPDADDRVYASEDDLVYASEEDLICDSKVDWGFPAEEMSMPMSASYGKPSLPDLLKKLDAGFSDTLLHYIDRSGKKDSEIYKKANIDRKLFSKIRNNPQYKPSKPTAVAFAIALELNLEETKDFIGRAGYALTRSSKFDVIIEYFITQRQYDIHEINMTLFEFDQSLLGA